MERFIYGVLEVLRECTGLILHDRFRYYMERSCHSLTVLY